MPHSQKPLCVLMRPQKKGLGREHAVRTLTLRSQPQDNNGENPSGTDTFHPLLVLYEGWGKCTTDELNIK